MVWVTNISLFNKTPVSYVWRIRDRAKTFVYDKNTWPMLGCLKHDLQAALPMKRCVRDSFSVLHVKKRKK